VKAEFTPEAESELTEASLWYESKEPGLGVRFRTERVNCPVFPYFLAYIVRGETIVIIAVAHSHRKPEYWVDR